MRGAMLILVLCIIGHGLLLVYFLMRGLTEQRREATCGSGFDHQVVHRLVLFDESQGLESVFRCSFALLLIVNE